MLIFRPTAAGVTDKRVDGRVGVLATFDTAQRRSIDPRRLLNVGEAQSVRFPSLAQFADQGTVLEVEELAQIRGWFLDRALVASGLPRRELFLDRLAETCVLLALSAPESRLVRGACDRIGF